MIANRLAAAALLVAASSCERAARNAAAAQPEAAALKGTLVIAASIAGQLVPCGCSSDQLGGLPRAAAAVKKLRQEGGLAFVDAGDLLFEAPPAPVMVEQAELKARTLARGEEAMGVAARVLGPRDLSRGAGFAAETAGQTPLLDAGGLPVPGARAGIVVQAGAVPVGLFAAGLSDESMAPAALQARVQKLRGEGARIVALLFQPRAAGVAAWSKVQSISAAARAAGVDLVVLGHRDDPASDLDQLDAGPPLMLAAQGHMQKLLRIDLSLPADARPGAALFLARGDAGKREALQRFDDRIKRLREQADSALAPERKKLYTDKIAEQERLREEAKAAVERAPEGAVVATVSLVSLDEKAGEDEGAKALVAGYDEQVAAMNLAAAKKMPESCAAAEKGEAAFTGISEKAPGGVEGCASCHATEAKFWAKTQHAHAYATLLKVKKALSLDCIQCHVTGWQQPGGVCRIDRTDVGGKGVALAGTARAGVGRQDVQCEACHGAGSEHAADPPGHIEAKVTRSACMRCHEAANSPHFNYEKYLPGVVGPGHGQALAKGQEPGPRSPRAIP